MFRVFLMLAVVEEILQGEIVALDSTYFGGNGGPLQPGVFTSVIQQSHVFLEYSAVLRDLTHKRVDQFQFVDNIGLKSILVGPKKISELRGLALIAEVTNDQFFRSLFR